MKDTGVANGHIQGDLTPEYVKVLGSNLRLPCYAFKTNWILVFRLTSCGRRNSLKSATPSTLGESKAWTSVWCTASYEVTHLFSVRISYLGATTSPEQAQAMMSPVSLSSSTPASTPSPSQKAKRFCSGNEFGQELLREMRLYIQERCTTNLLSVWWTLFQVPGPRRLWLADCE